MPLPQKGAQAANVAGMTGGTQKSNTARLLASLEANRPGELLRREGRRTSAPSVSESQVKVNAATAPPSAIGVTPAITASAVIPSAVVAAPIPPPPPSPGAVRCGGR